MDGKEEKGWGKKGTRLPGKLHSTAPPGNNTTSHICAMIHSAHRGEQRGGWESNDTGTIAEEWMNEWRNEWMKRIQFWVTVGWRGAQRHVDACQWRMLWLWNARDLFLFYSWFRSLFRSLSALCVSHPPFPVCRHRAELVSGWSEWSCIV